MPDITNEYKDAVYSALVQLGGEADTVQILRQAEAIAPKIDFGGSGSVCCALRRLENAKKLGFVSRVSLNTGGAKKGATSRNFWRIAGQAPKQKVTEERLFYVRCTVGELQKILNPEDEEITDSDVPIIAASPVGV